MFLTIIALSEGFLKYDDAILWGFYDISSGKGWIDNDFILSYIFLCCSNKAKELS